MSTLDSEGDWQALHDGSHGFRYEEFHDGEWRGIRVDGEWLSGRPHHVIYFAAPAQWLEYPDWARDRRDEIIARIKSKLREPDYTYE